MIPRTDFLPDDNCWLWIWRPWRWKRSQADSGRDPPSCVFPAYTSRMAEGGRGTRRKTRVWVAQWTRHLSADICGCWEVDCRNLEGKILERRSAISSCPHLCLTPDREQIKSSSSTNRITRLKLGYCTRKRMQPT